MDDVVQDGIKSETAAEDRWTHSSKKRLRGISSSGFLSSDLESQGEDFSSKFSLHASMVGVDAPANPNPKTRGRRRRAYWCRCLPWFRCYSDRRLSFSRGVFARFYRAVKTLCNVALLTAFVSFKRLRDPDRWWDMFYLRWYVWDCRQKLVEWCFVF